MFNSFNFKQSYHKHTHPMFINGLPQNWDFIFNVYIFTISNATFTVIIIVIKIMLSLYLSETYYMSVTMQALSRDC